MKISFSTSNASFRDPDGNEDEYYECREAARILRLIADKLEDYDTCGSIRDCNGNKIGEYTL